MNRSAYLTTGLAIKLFSSFSKADIVLHGQKNLPKGPTIFVFNHFTRIETILLPYYFYNLTGVPVWSLAAAELFKGGLEKFFDLVGVISTQDPNRDRLIINSLVSGDANWIIFPEGRLVKTKKIFTKGKFLISHPGGSYEPHTGAAALGLKAELVRQQLLLASRNDRETMVQGLKALGVGSINEISELPISIVPVNLTYYPIRAAENIALGIASKLVKDMPERMVEEIMTEGTMLLSGVDLDVHIGKPINLQDQLPPQWLADRGGVAGYSVSAAIKGEMKEKAHVLMRRYMGEIYGMTTVNHEHLFASFLRLYPFRRVDKTDFRRRVYLAANLLREPQQEGPLHLHKSLLSDQSHLLTDDRFGKFHNFLALAKEKEIVREENGAIRKDPSLLSRPLSFHRVRMDNPIEIMANEVEPLLAVQKVIRRLSWQPNFWLRLQLIRYMLQANRTSYTTACGGSADHRQTECSGLPFLLPALRRRLGVVLVHSYLAIPEEVRSLATYLNRCGFWVYAPRLPGHGTSLEDLSRRKAQEWFEAVENGFALLGMLCGRVALGGIGVGGNLAMDVACRNPSAAGVFAVCTPYSLKDYSTKFMPATDVWNRIVSRFKRGEQSRDFLEFTSGNRHVNYPGNSVAGIKEVGEYLESLEKRYKDLAVPVLLAQADRNPIVDPRGTRKIFDALANHDKELSIFSFDRHVITEGPGMEKVHQRIARFLEELL